MARKLKDMSLIFAGINKARELNANEQYEQRVQDFVLGANSPENYDGLAYVLTSKTLTQIHIVNVLTPCLKVLGEKAVKQELVKIQDGFIKASVLQALDLVSVASAEDTEEIEE